MVNALIVAWGLLAVSGTPSTPSEADLKSYDEARAQAKRDPAAHVRLALWCEAHGMEAERIKHLGIAVLSDPNNPVARGLLGLVAYQGQWQSPEKVADKVHSDADLAASLAEYNDKRDKTPHTADAQWQLALWCEQKGLKPEATAHLTTVVRLDSRREDAWKHLGYKKHNGHWTTDAQLSAAKAEVEAQKLADHHWKGLVEKWKGWLSDKARKADGEAALAQVSDPRALPSVLRVFAVGNVADQGRAVQVLGQIDSPGASKALAMLSVFGKSAEVRRASAETLIRRDPRDYLDLLISMVRKPIKYEVRPVGGPGSPGELFVEGKKFNLDRRYAPPAAPNVALRSNDSISYDVNGLPVISRFVGMTAPVSLAPNQLPNRFRNELPTSVGSPLSASDWLPADPFVGDGGTAQVLNEIRSSGPALQAPVVQQKAGTGLRDPGMQYDMQAPVFAQIPIGQMINQAQQAAKVAQAQLENDVASLKQTNAQFNSTNDRILPVLKNATGQDLGNDPEAWAKWWTNTQGYAIAQQVGPSTIPTVVENVPIAAQPQAGVRLLTGPPVIVGFHHSCFGAGTAVHTLSGTQSIETLHPGDRVLTQNTKSGALGFQPILAVYHNAPNQTLRVNLGGESIVVTGIHRFWKAGKGWVMARDLTEGDTIRALGGLMAVTSIETHAVQPVFNLEVAEGHSFFVGKQGALVHDNSLVKPALNPFDAEPELALAASIQKAAE